MSSTSKSLPRISIVIPVYNYGDFLPTALASVVEQNDSNLEIIVVDDGSEDSTADITQSWISDYPDLVRYWRQPNKGPGAARNRGSELSSGGFLLFLDADDWLLPGALALFRKTITSHHKADLIYVGYCSVDRNGSPRNRPAPRGSSTKLENFKRFVRGRLCVCNGGAILVRKNVLDVLQYPETIWTGEDYVFFSQAFALFSCVSISDPVVAITKHAGSLRNNYEVLMAAGMQMVDLLFNVRVLPQACFALKTEIRSRWCLVVSRALYKHGDYTGAKRMYQQGIRIYPLNVALTSYLRKYLTTIARLTIGVHPRATTR